MTRSFRGEAGRPFGTVAALICLVFTLALVTLGRIAANLTGTALAVSVTPGRLAAMHDVWGLFLAAEIVHVVAGGVLLLAVWTLPAPIGPRTPRSTVALAVGTLAAVAMIVAGRQGIVTAAHLSVPEILPHTALVATLGRLGVAGAGIWAALTALEARRAQSLPKWVQDAGLLLGAAAVGAFVFPALTLPAALIALVWWGGLFATLYRPEDRLAR